MPKHHLSNHEFQEQLKEQLYFLECSILNYSNAEFEAKRVALTVRNLLHDTGNSTSLLKSLNQKNTLKFIDSASSNDGKLHSMTGMIGVRGANSNQYFGLVAKINSNNKLTIAPLFQQHLPEWHKKYNELSFNNWWGMEILNVNQIGITRKELILDVVNKDGGAHVDTFLPEKYHKVKNSRLKLNVKGNEVEFDKNVVYASVVQIGWELLNSIKTKLI